MAPSGASSCMKTITFSPSGVNLTYLWALITTEIATAVIDATENKITGVVISTDRSGWGSNLIG